MDGFVSPALERPLRTQREAALDLIHDASVWLYRANDAGSIMATHAVAMASEKLDRAAELLPVHLAEEARALSVWCEEAISGAGFPLLDGLHDAAEALHALVAASEGVRP